MAERPKAVVLKTTDPKGSGGSNPSPSARHKVERWPSGRRRQIANLLRGYPAPPRVRIPASPPFLFLLALAAMLVSCSAPSLKIESYPSGAALFIDGELKGRTPLTVKADFPGQRRIEVSKKGMQTRTLVRS